MSEARNKSVLSKEKLEAATYLALEASALTDMDGVGPPRSGLGMATWRRRGQRRQRFAAAQEALLQGASSALELGLTVTDLDWAVEMADRAKDPEDWRQCFEAAKQELVSLLDIKALRDLSGKTYAVQHNPNCPQPFLVRLIRRPNGHLDLKPVNKTKDILAYGQYFHQAAETALLQAKNLEEMENLPSWAQKSR